MIKGKFLFAIITTTVFLMGTKANAQFNSILQKAKDKAAQKASEMMDKKPAEPEAAPNKKSGRLTINSGFDFVAGDSILFADNFSANANGTAPLAFKTNGSGSIVTLKEEGGKWLSLQDHSTYKLTRQLFYPKHFTVEFDIIAAADQIKDIYPMLIGFTKDNSVREYNSGDGAYINLMYYNDNQVSINSSYLDKYSNATFDLNPYANRKMHVAVNVDGERMAVYLDQTKLADTELFLANSPKNFYFSAPMTYHNGSRLLVGNFTIATFKKNQ